MTTARMPGCIRWHARAIRAASIGPLLLGLLYVSLGWTGSRSLLLVWFVVSVIGVLAIREGVRRAALRVCREALKRHGRACLNCRFDLTASPESGQCPECGTWYSVTDTTQVWASAEEWLKRKRFRS